MISSRDNWFAEIKLKRLRFRGDLLPLIREVPEFRPGAETLNRSQASKWTGKANLAALLRRLWS